MAKKKQKKNVVIIVSTLKDRHVLVGSTVVGRSLGGCLPAMVGEVGRGDDHIAIALGHTDKHPKVR